MNGALSTDWRTIIDLSALATRLQALEACASPHEQQAAFEQLNTEVARHDLEVVIDEDHCFAVRVRTSAPHGQPGSAETQEVAREQATFISLPKATKELGISRGTIYYYLAQLKIPLEKFHLDRKGYISLVDFERIKTAKKKRTEGTR